MTHCKRKTKLIEQKLKSALKSFIGKEHSKEQQELILRKSQQILGFELMVAGKPSFIPCQHCGCKKEVIYEPSRTAYYWDKNKEALNPNAPIPLCRKCAKEHHEHWDEMWENYYSGLL